jgi:hypothetical protein
MGRRVARLITLITMVSPLLFKIAVSLGRTQFSWQLSIPMYFKFELIIVSVLYRDQTESTTILLRIFYNLLNNSNIVYIGMISA